MTSPPNHMPVPVVPRTMSKTKIRSQRTKRFIPPSCVKTAARPETKGELAVKEV
jgi:hypothetical protein